MNELAGLGRLLLVFGIVLAIGGVLLMAGVRLPLGRLPGDFTFGGPGWRVYVPLGTCLLLSIVLTLLVQLFVRR